MGSSFSIGSFGLLAALLWVCFLGCCLLILSFLDFRVMVFGGFGVACGGFFVSILLFVFFCCFWLIWWLWCCGFVSCCFVCFWFLFAVLFGGAAFGGLVCIFGRVWCDELFVR